MAYADCADATSLYNLKALKVGDYLTLNVAISEIQDVYSPVSDVTFSVVTIDEDISEEESSECPPDEPSEEESSECPPDESSEEPSYPDYSEDISDDVSDDVSEDFNIDFEMGNENSDSEFDIIVEAPISYKGNDEITVKVKVSNITNENGISVLTFVLKYDSNKLVLLNDLDESDENMLDCISKMPEGWENLTSVAFVYDEITGEAIPLNDGIIVINVGTAELSNAVKSNGELEFTFTFAVADDASGDTYVYVPHETVVAGANVDYALTEFSGNGSYALLEEYSLGDADGDGIIGVKDYVLTKRAVMGTFEMTEEQRESADVNSDGKLNIFDYILIKRHVMGTFIIGG
jgi:hypothetical protein